MTSRPHDSDKAAHHEYYQSQCQSVLAPRNSTLDIITVIRAVTNQPQQQQQNKHKLTGMSLWDSA